MKATLWTEARPNGTIISNGKGDGLIVVKPGQVVLVAVFDPTDPAVSRALRLLDLIASGSAEVVA